MKIQTILFSFALLCSTQISAQDSVSVGSEGNNEIKFNVLLPLLETVEIEYERIISPNTGVGVAASYWFNEDASLNFITTPYFRFYPSDKKRASNYFIEGNMAVVGYDKEFPVSNGSSMEIKEESSVKVGAGLAVGGKYITQSGFFGEAFAGVGRIFGSDDFLEFYPRVGISLGKRF